jgi:hypothetical protein
VRRRIPLVFAIALGACTSDATGPEGALEQALARARAQSTAGAPALPDAAARPGTRTSATLELTYRGAHGEHALVIARVIDQQGARFRVRDERRYTAPAAADPSVSQAHVAKVESLFDGERFAWRHGAGPWIERDVLDGLAKKTLASAHDLADLTLAMLGDYLHASPAPAAVERPSSIAGLGVTWSALALDPAVRPKALDDATLVALRDHEPSVARWLTATHRPERVSGRLARAADGRVLAAELSAAGTTPFAEGPAPFALTLTLDTAPLPADASFVLPAERLPESRERPWLMIEDVLGDGLLPPYRIRQ